MLAGLAISEMPFSGNEALAAAVRKCTSYGLQISKVCEL